MPDVEFSLIECQKQNPNTVSISDASKKAMENALRSFTSDQWDSDKWNIYIPTSQRHIVLKFPVVSQIDADILKATALRYLIECASTDAAQRIVREGGYFIQYLHQRGLRVENTSTSIVQAYIKKLERLNISDAVILSRVRSAKAIFDTCIENDLVKTNNKVVFHYTAETQREPKRPPDACVTDELDKLVLNLPDEDIPLLMRTLYLMVRMIPSRISEVLAMGINCIKYPEKGLFAVSKPESKETPLHLPIYKDYVFSLDGPAEELLHRYTCELITINKSIDMLEYDADYLFYDKNHTRVLRIDDFNDFLSYMVSNYNLRNEDGSVPEVTSHTFRHLTIGERLRSGIFSVEDTAEEAGHSDPNVTLGYGYQSSNDEAKRLNEIVEKVIQDELFTQFNGATKQRIMNSVKYARIQDNMPFLRLIPIIGACDDRSCSPQYAQCVDCDSFQPNPIYLDYFVAVREIILKRLDNLYKGGAEEAILFEEYELEIIEKYIAKMDSSIILERPIMKGGISYYEQTTVVSG